MSRTICLLFAAGVLLGGKAAGQSFTYTVENSKTTITGFSAEPSGTVIVPATLGGYTVTEIGRSAFKDRTGITSITFASGTSVTKIGASAFQGCTGLQSISLPAGATVLPSGVLQGCTALTSVTIPSTVVAIQSAAFAECRSLPSITLPSSLISLEASAFLNCRSLTSIIVPSGVTSVSDQLFEECRALNSVTLPAGITSIGMGAFTNCLALTSFTLPASTQTLGKDAFRGCSALASVEINAALASIGDQAFEGCSALSSISVDSSNTTYSSSGNSLFNKAQSAILLFPAGRSGSYSIPSSVTTLGKASFAHCRLLTSLTIPSSVTSLEEDALYYATGLTALTLPNSVTTIGAWALAGCMGLTSINIPSSVTSIGANAFANIPALAYALFNGAAPTFGETAFDGASSGFTIFYYSSQSGYSTLGYTATALTSSANMVAWLQDNGLSPGESFLSDPNNDGVTLLTAYALGLDPTANLISSVPAASYADDLISLSYNAAKSDVIYTVQTSTDLVNWTTTGITTSNSDSIGLRTATAAIDSTAARQFLRLVISY